MTALLLMLTRPIVTRTSGALLRLLRACRDGVARYVAHREALARLREFDDAELQDIGLTRSQIEPAVRGRCRRS